MQSNLSQLQSKIVSLEAITTLAEDWRTSGKKVVFTNGCFDLIHPGHIDYLAKAADLGDKLVIGLNADISVKQLDKGPARPLQDENARAMIMAAFGFVDAVVLFSEDTPHRLISAVQPDFLVKGGDYKKEEVVGYNIVSQRGGEVVIMDFLPGHSTTLIEQKIKQE